MSEQPVILEASGLVKEFQKPGALPIRVMDGLDLTVRAGERVAVKGESGVGKSTLLNLLGGLDRADAGTILHGGEAIPLEPGARARWRRRSVGFIFQFHGLLNEFTAVENVALAGLVSGWPRRRALTEGRSWLSRMGLGERMEHFPDELSGGEQQRVAVGRALLTGPPVVLADEPTGNLDPDTGNRVLDQLIEVQEHVGFALVVATHSEKLAERCDRVLWMREGRLEGAEPDGTEREPSAGARMPS